MRTTKSHNLHTLRWLPLFLFDGRTVYDPPSSIRSMTALPPPKIRLLRWSSITYTDTLDEAHMGQG